MRRWILLILASSLIASSADAQLRYIDPNPKTGSSAAVVVPDSTPLAHTAQFLTSESTARAQLDDLLRQIDSAMPMEHLRDKPGLVKLNFVLSHDELREGLLDALAIRFAADEKPAVSFVTGKLPNGDAQAAVDAVIAWTGSIGRKQVAIHEQSAILPQGARVWISGQAEKGADLADATRKTMASLRDSLQSVGLKDNAIVQVKAFLQPMSDVAVARREIERFFGNQRVPPLVFVEWKSSLPIEIELVAWAGRDRAGVPIEYLTPPGMKASPVYSRIARVNYGKLIYVSGLHADKGEGPAAEIPEIFDALGGILKKAGSDYRHLAKATYYVTNADAVKKMGEIRPRYYDPKRPPAASLAMTEGTGRAGKSVTLDMIAVPSPTENINEYGPPEYGFGLTEKDVFDGWISLFDGKTTFGWKDAKVEKGRLVRGSTTLAASGDFEIKAEIAQAGKFIIGGVRAKVNPGPFQTSSSGVTLPIRLQDGVAIRTLHLRPIKLQTLFNGKDLAGWKRIDRANTPPDRLAKWTVQNRAIHAVGGPGALEYQGQKFGDLIWQIEARMNVRQANGGLFFRAIPGDFMNGYEAQLYNRCIDGDPNKPAIWATGAIDDRQNARRLMSRDGHWFVQTVIARGPHIATWVNGHQTVDWTDTRAEHENPRHGLRIEPGALQLQAHDAGTDIEFRKVRARALE